MTASSPNLILYRDSPMQAGGPFGGGRPNQMFPPEFFALFVIILVSAIAIGLTIQILYLLTLSRCFSRIAPRNRRMEPGLVWLNLIPCFQLIWIFFTTTRLADSLRDEFDDRRLRGDRDFGRTLGITYPILMLVGFVPYLGAIFSLASLICWILYWVKIAGYKNQLISAGIGTGRHDDEDDDRPRRRRDEDDDDGDDRPRRRPRRDDDE